MQVQQSKKNPKLWRITVEPGDLYNQGCIVDLVIQPPMPTPPTEVDEPGNDQPPFLFGMFLGILLGVILTAPIAWWIGGDQIERDAIAHGHATYLKWDHKFEWKERK